MKITNILICIILLITIPLISSVSLGTFKTNDCVNLIQTCSNCTYANITSVIYPNSSVALSNVVMTKDGTYYNYSFCRTSLNGLYIATGFGDPDGSINVWNYDFNVTPAGGAERNTTFFIIIILIALGLILISFIFKNYIFAFFGGLTFLICGVYGMIYGYGDVTTNFTRMISLILLGLGAIVTILSGLDLLQSVEGKDNREDDF
jgi:hypothetical protein